MPSRKPRRQARKAGLPPGTPLYVGEERAESVRITVFDYDEHSCSAREIKDVAECFPFKDSPTVTWINFDGLSDPQLIERLGTHFGLHPLVLEDIVNTTQRPKTEQHEGYLFTVIKMLSRPNPDGPVEAEQVSLVLGQNFVLSFQERPGDVFDPVRERIRSAKGRIRKAGADYLVYALIDAVIDNYFAILEGSSEKIEQLDERIVTGTDRAVPWDIHRVKQELVFLRRSIWPLRDSVTSLLHVEPPLVAEATGVYLRDIYDHTLRVMETVEGLRDEVAGMRDTYMSEVSNRMNEIMKVLTIIATIFIPITFIAGVYGMNFKNMPEIGSPWGYPAALLVMIGTALAMLGFFRRKKWI
jgi:magnesium transporter